MKTKILQIIYDMRHQPVIAWVTVLGTALSIFLILVVVMMQQVGVIAYAPESNRDRMLYGMYLHTSSTDEAGNNSSAGLSYKRCVQLYGDLDGVENMTVFRVFLEAADASGDDNVTRSVKARMCDDRFWQIFDHTLLAGRYFTDAEVAANAPVAILSESTARKLFGTADVVGKVMKYNHMKFTVIGVVADSSELATMASGDVFVPFAPNNSEYTWSENFGDYAAGLLVKPGVDFEHVRDQVKSRYAMLDTELAANHECTVYHEAPYDQKTIASGSVHGSNVTPDTTTDDVLRGIIYAILLLVPAINLSSMLHSRMRRRVSEIGVRRAYGCTRSRVIADIIAENMIVTVAGGVIGLVAAVIFAMTYDGIFEVDNGSASPALGMILNVGTIVATFVACLILNIISASIPAWQASRVNPVEAINSNRN